jgi:hypothetical protein
MLWYNIRCATQQDGAHGRRRSQSGRTIQEVARRRHRRLYEIKTELQQLGQQIDARLAVLADKLVQPEQERRQ